MKNEKLLEAAIIKILEENTKNNFKSEEKEIKKIIKNLEECNEITGKLFYKYMKSGDEGAAKIINDLSMNFDSEILFLKMILKESEKNE